jgi:hypothetical protein
MSSNPEKCILRRNYRLQLSIKIVLVTAGWWLLLALLSRLDISALQQVWTSEAVLAIFVYFPACILTGGLIAAIVSNRIHSRDHGTKACFPFTEKLFYAFIIIFLGQCICIVPPILSKSPNDARLEWGMPFVHVLTEIVIRVMCLLVVGNICVRRKFLPRDRCILILSIIYTLMVVSRSFMLEIFFYWGIASIASYRGRNLSFKLLLKIVSLGILFFWFFIVYGNLRQGSNFSIVEYGEMKLESNVLAWFFGYFLANFDNLALLIGEQYTNTAFSNTFGSILQTLKIAKFEHVDDYLYIGKFNLGTAFRPFVLDYGVWGGGLVFLSLWSLILVSPVWCRKSASRYAIQLLIAYSAFCLPITSRIEQPPYLFALIWILIADKIVIVRRSPVKAPRIDLA